MTERKEGFEFVFAGFFAQAGPGAGRGEAVETDLSAESGPGERDGMLFALPHFDNGEFIGNEGDVEGVVGPGDTDVVDGRVSAAF